MSEDDVAWVRAVGVEVRIQEALGAENVRIAVDVFATCYGPVKVCPNSMHELAQADVCAYQRFATTLVSFGRSYPSYRSSCVK